MKLHTSHRILSHGYEDAFTPDSIRPVRSSLVGSGRVDVGRLVNNVASFMRFLENVQQSHTDI